jgi:acetyltransferase-like isoleucine patch superfamily enzyme
MFNKSFFNRIKKGINYKNYVKDYDIDPTSSIQFGEKTFIDYAKVEDYVNLDFFQGSAANLNIGRCTYAGPIQLHGYNGDLDIGRYCSIAGRLLLICGDGFHRIDRISSFPFPFKEPFNELIDKRKMYSDVSKFSKNKLIIGNDVWIGEDVLITKNVNIGNGVIIGSKSVVTNDMPSYSIVGGNPAEVLKFRHGDDEIRMLEEIKWWDWCISDIIKEIDLFSLTGSALKNKLSELSTLL